MRGCLPGFYYWNWRLIAIGPGLKSQRGRIEINEDRNAAIGGARERLHDWQTVRT
jgi:hypothetical protein